MFGAASLAAAGLMVASPWANAAQTYLGTSHFEIDTDANLVVDGASPSIDWADTDRSTSGSQPGTFHADNASGKSDNSFGQGTSENDLVPTIVSGSIPPQKSDLTDLGVYTGEKGYLHLAWARVQEPNGNTNMDFEFNQLRASSTYGNHVTPQRSDGDLLIEYHLANGGATATLSKRTWNGTTNVWGPELDMGTNAIGAINSSAISETNAAPITHSLSARTFGEATIDLTQIFSGATCRHFGSVYLKSRSSDSFSSEIKDFVSPQNVDLTNCRSLVVKKVNAAGALLSGAAFRLQRTVDSVTTNYPMTESSSTPGLFCVDNLDLATYTLQETTAPAGYTAAADSSVTITSSSSQDSCTARLAADPVVVDVTVTDSPQPGTINIAKKDDSSPTALAISGASFTVFNDVGILGTYEPSVDTTVFSGPTATASDGTLTVSNVPLGRYCVVETTTPAHYDTAAAQCVNVVVTSGGQVINLTFNDPRQHRIIVLVCHEGTDTLDPSSVTLGSDTKTSLAAGSLTAAQQKALCDTGGASFGDLSGHTARSLSVTPG